MRAVILCAGQGKRLLPLTESRPKCLLPIAGRPVLEWQLLALAANGIRDVTVVTGFRADRVDEMLAGLGPLAEQVRTRFNPFFTVSDNTGSCFLVRDILEDGSRNAGGTVLINGDTLFEPAILGRLIAQASRNVTVTIDRKPAYDSDDMKVALEGDRLVSIGKTLPLEIVDGESIGMLLFRGEGGGRFAAGVTEALRQPEGLKRWYLSVIDSMAAHTEVGIVSIEGLSWGEIDFPADLAQAERLGQGWLAAEEKLLAAD